MSDLVSRLRDLSACKHDDLSVGNEAADAIEQLERENRDIKYIACQLGEDKLELERELAEAQRDAERYRFLRGKSMLGGNQFYSRIMEIHDEEIDKARGA